MCEAFPAINLFRWWWRIPYTSSLLFNTLGPLILFPIISCNIFSLPFLVSRHSNCLTLSWSLNISAFRLPLLSYFWCPNVSCFFSSFLPSLLPSFLLLIPSFLSLLSYSFFRIPSFVLLLSYSFFRIPSSYYLSMAPAHNLTISITHHSYPIPYEVNLKVIYL